MHFTVRASGAPERESGDPAEVALENALAKARAGIREGSGEVVIGCDTIVALDGSIYGKPPDVEAARGTLGSLAGRTHEVLSGLAVLDGDRELTALERTHVSFRELSEPMISWYVATGEWQGRAGGYAIQGAGAALVRSVEGDYENVVGLPLARLLDLYPALLST